MEELKGTKNVQNIESAKERILIPKIKNMKGEIITSRKGIAEVFGEIYEKLYDDDEENNDKPEVENEEGTCKKAKNPQNENFERIPEFTASEIQDAIDRLKRGKAGDSSAIRAEHIKRCDSETKEWTRQIFNEIVQQKDCTPQTRRRIRIKVIHKKGDVEDAGNYRPICARPVLYKLLATALYARLAPTQDKCQPPDQSGFRPHPPNCRPFDAGAALPRVGCTAVHLDDRLREKIGI